MLPVALDHKNQPFKHFVSHLVLLHFIIDNNQVQQKIKKIKSCNIQRISVSFYFLIDFILCYWLYATLACLGYNTIVSKVLKFFASLLSAVTILVSDLLACCPFRKFRKASKSSGEESKTNIINMPMDAVGLKVRWTIL